MQYFTDIIVQNVKEPLLVQKQVILHLTALESSQNTFLPKKVLDQFPFFWIGDSWRFWNNKYGAIMNQRDEGLAMMRKYPTWAHLLILKTPRTELVNLRHLALIFQHYWWQLNWSLSNVAFFEIFWDIDFKNILQRWWDRQLTML